MKKTEGMRWLMLCILVVFEVGCSAFPMQPSRQESLKEFPIIQAIRVAVQHVSGTPVAANLRDQQSEENPLVYFVTIVAIADRSIHQVIVNADTLKVVGEQPVLH